MEGKEDRTAYWLEALAYTDKDGNKKFSCVKQWEPLQKQKAVIMVGGLIKYLFPMDKNATLANFDDVDGAWGMLWSKQATTNLQVCTWQKQITKNNLLIKNHLKIFCFLQFLFLTFFLLTVLSVYHNLLKIPPFENCGQSDGFKTLSFLEIICKLSQYKNGLRVFQQQTFSVFLYAGVSFPNNNSTSQMSIFFQFYMFAY